MSCREWPKQKTQTHECGAELRCRRKSKGSRCWGHLLVTMISCLFAGQDVRNIKFCAIPTMPDVQSAWLLLLHFASARANYYLRIVRPELVATFSRTHDEGFWKCLSTIVDVSIDTCETLMRATATLPLSLGGLGLRSEARTQLAAYWPMIQTRHPAVADLVLRHASPSLRAASEAATELEGVQAFEVA